MLDKLRKLFSDNSFRSLLAGDLAVTDAIINSFVARVGTPPPLTRLTVLCRRDVIEAEGEGELAGVRFSFQGSVTLLGLKISRTQQIVRLMPAGPLRFTTPNVDAAISIRPGPDLLEDLRRLLLLAPADQVQGIVIEPDALLLRLHDNPVWRDQFKKQLAELPLSKKFGVNPLDYVEITDLKIEPGVIRLSARRT